MGIFAMSDTWILYQTTNLVNGKIYIGVHKVANTAKSRNYIGSGYGLKSAIKIYGKDKFSRITLAEFTCREEAYSAEEAMVTEEFINRPDTYNMCLGGRGGGIQTPEMRARNSAAKKGRKLSEEHKLKIGAAGKGRVFSDEHRAKMSAALIGNTRNLGKKKSEEAMNKLIATQKERAKNLTDEDRAILSARAKGNKSNLGRVFSDEHKAKLRAASTKNIPVVVHGKYYTSIGKAAKFEKISPSAAKRRLESYEPERTQWRYATEEDTANFLAMVNLAE